MTTGGEASAPQITVLPYAAGQADDLAQIFFDAVRLGARPKYSEQACAVWAPQRPTAQDWAARLTGLATFVATVATVTVGFMALREKDGYLDLAFVAPDWRRRGVADALHGAVLAHARRCGVQHLTTHASLMAEPFLTRHGWHNLGDASVIRAGIALPRFLMTCDLEALP